MDTLNLKLYTICFLDSVSLGCLVPILSTHIFTLGGTHTTVGFLAGLHFLFQLLSVPLIRTLRQSYGSKQILVSTLALNFAAYFCLGITSSYLCAVLLRLIYAISNQTQTLCKDLASENGLPADKQEEIYNVMNAMSVAGVICGPIAGGYMYEFEGGFFHITLLSSSALLLSLLLSSTLPKSSKTESQRTSFLSKVTEGFESSRKIANGCDLNRQWAPVLLKVLYHSSTTIFFIKFSLLLKTNYDVSYTVIGFTYAYQNILTFLAQFAPLYLKQTNFTPITYTLTFLSILLSMYTLNFAPSYDLYLFTYIPMIIAHTFIDRSWKELYSKGSTPVHNIMGLDDVVAKTTSIVVPMIFGFFCDFYGYKALQAFVILPLALNVMLSATATLDGATVEDRKLD